MFEPSAAQLIKHPQLYVKAKINWGKIKNLFARGYKAIKGVIIIPKIIASKFNCIRIKNPITKRVIKRIKAFLILIFEDAKALFFVLITFLSISVSIKSLTIHPADLIIIEPRKNIRNKIKTLFDIILPEDAKTKLTG